ncbi:exodeoxyribonuclease V subunit gamma, partial [Roseisolibacter sp. H3M3-2]|uniref:exodeoxyribonuclease V subunit gamma n=1 Tax=Roseisolibacter sp. H3M3-2 TaxID=3031323 RepID=UPI0023DCC643
MLTLHRSARLDRLADALAEVLRTPPDDPLAPEWVVVGSRPLERWLHARMAERLGVCAQVRFLSPSSLAEAVVEHTLGVSRDAVRAWGAERLTWRVLGALPALLPHDAFAPVRAYLRRDAEAADGAPADVVDARAWSFARRVAEGFARYAAADWERVRAWDAGADEGDARDAWQPILWRALSRGDDGAPTHLAALVARAERALRDGSRPAPIPARLSWVALPGAAPLHARVVATLAAVGVEVHALLPLPPRPGDAAAPLRRSLGRAGDRLDDVLDAACRAGGVAPAPAPADDPVPAAPTALDVLRHALLGGTAGAPAALRDDDDSWRVHACHGPVRQAEVLRDALLALLDADPTLRPRDVLVLTPDPTLAAPLVEAAFAATSGAAALPLRVLDRPQRRTNPVADVVLRLLDLASGRVDAVAVLDLVTLPPVAATFGLDAGTEDVLRRWVRESGVRWGLDGADRADRHGLPADEEHTWRFGLERLLLGWGLPGDGETLWGGALPLDMAEGGEAERLGRFAEACARTFEAVRAVRGPLPPAAWRDVLRHVADALVDDDGAELVLARRAWRDALDTLADGGAACARPSDAQAVRLALAARFDEPAG